MPRFMAISKVQNLNEDGVKKIFPGERTSEWRPDARTTIVKTYASYPAGVVITECDAVEQDHFVAWLKKVGLDSSNVFQVSAIKQGPNLWKM
jgi:hypothetical protein